MTLTMRVKFDKYWGDLTRLNILLYVATIFYPRLKISGMLYDLGLAYDQALTDLIGEMARDILYRFYDEFNAIKGGTASSTPTPTPTPPPDTRATKKRRLA